MPTKKSAENKARTPKKRYTPEYVRELTARLWKWAEGKDSLWLGDFAAENKMSRQRLSEIAAHDPGFAEAYEVAKQVQENRLFKIGLSKKYNASMPIFALKNVAGWRDSFDDTGSINEHIGEIAKSFAALVSASTFGGKPQGH